MLTSKERLLRVLSRETVDRPPVICTGGMMNAAIVEIMNTTGHTLPEAHTDQGLMAQLAADVQRFTGFENIGVPFCMTVEAEILGSEVSYGSLGCEPKVVRERYASLAEVQEKDITAMLDGGRVGIVLAAIGEAAAANPGVPVIGNVCGPISLAASLVDPVALLKGLRKDKTGAHRVLAYVSEVQAAFACRMAEHGADVISIGDPTATGEILGPAMFEEYAVRYINRIIDAVHQKGTKVILHICGNMNRVWELIPRMNADAISVDAVVSLQKLKKDFPQVITMGNVSTYLLQDGPEEAVRRTAKRLAAEGVDIIAPACGLSTSTSIGMIRAMTGAVKGEE
ncbi:MAG: uroporphyrinogen decarboxylase family protein [Negativicutes bacterium]|nr:uroporphyrinogen decarboxylase family protein [Negativicutes bacterium]